MSAVGDETLREEGTFDRIVGDDSEILRRIVSRTAPPRSSHLKAPDISQVSSRLHKCSATTDAKK